MMARTARRPPVRVPHAAILAALACAAALSALALAVAADAGVGGGALVLALFAANGALGVGFLVKSVVDAPFSMAQVHWVFYVTFLVVAPMSQYLYGYSCWGYPLSDSDYVATSLLVSLWGVLFAIASNVGGRGARRPWEGFHDRFYASLPLMPGGMVVAAVLISAVCTIAVVGYVGFANLFARDTYSTGLDKTASLLFNAVVRSAPVFCLVVAMVRRKQEGDCMALVLVALALVLIADFPTGMARYNAAAVYGGLALLAWRPLMERRGLFPLLFLLAFLVVFPAINVFRVNELDLSMLLGALGDAVANLPSGFCAGDYDAYSMLARTLRYVGSEGPSLGGQLLTALLFFVPRSLWAGKSVGSGQMVAEAQGQVYTNLSSPLPAEGYINFGVAGVVLFALLFGASCRRLQAWFEGASGAGRCFYPFGCLMCFFVMRGDLLSGCAYTAGFAVTFVLIWWLAGKLALLWMHKSYIYSIV